MNKKIGNKLSSSLKHFSQKYDIKLLLIHTGYIAIILNTLCYTCLFMYSLYYLDYSLLPGAFFYRVFSLLLPPFIWILGTKYSFYNFHRRKLISILVIGIQEVIILLSVIFQALSRIFLPAIMDLKTDDIFTKTMVLFLGRIITQLPLLLFAFLFGRVVFHIMHEDKTKDLIINFKINHHIARKMDKEVQYNMNIVTDMRTGKVVPVQEKDRYLHTLADGTSGTGKTSSTILPAIRDDLRMRCKAEDLQKIELKKLVDPGYIIYTLRNKFFTINNFLPVFIPETDPPDNQKSDIEKKLEYLRLKYPVAGVTAMAPDDSLTDSVCDLCEAYSIPYNRIDATLHENRVSKKNCIGMNPFYIPMDIVGEERDHHIVKKAVIFSDVLQAITDLKGKADSYFSGLNRQMLSNLSILVMVTVPELRNVQPTPEDLQLLINNFDLLPEYVDKLIELDREKNQYTFVIQYIKEDLLGKGRTKMEDQSRGTRNIINEFLLIPAHKKIFCSQTSIDFDRALSNGEVTVCNYNLAAGDSDALAFGLTFLLLFNNAVLSRPGTENTRTPHFFYCDELPVILHQSIEKNFSLFRKYRVANFVSIQTLDQFEKNEMTRYLKGVILGSAHIIAFGRSSLNDMQIFSALAGVKDTVYSQKTISETSISQTDPQLSYSTRDTPTQENVIEEIGVRMRDFQEVTFFTTKDNRPLEPIHGKVSFLSKKDWKPIHREMIEFKPINVRWGNYSSVVNEDSPVSLPTTTLSYFTTTTRNRNDHNNTLPDVSKEPYTSEGSAAIEEDTSINHHDGGQKIDDLFD